MVDVVDRATRSRMMAGIRGKHTQPELMLRRALHGRGFRYRLHVTRLPGRPDILLSKYRAAIEVRGCFWHRHDDCRFCTTPASNVVFWKSKFEQTIERDRRNEVTLLEAGWRIAIVWECELVPNRIDAVADKLAKWLAGTGSFVEIPARKKFRDTLPQVKRKSAATRRRNVKSAKHVGKKRNSA